MAHVDDLIEPSPKQITLPALPTLLRPHRINSSARSPRRTNHGPQRRAICKKTVRPGAKSGKSYDFRAFAHAHKSAVSAIFTDDFIAGASLTVDGGTNA
jgi:hypothetical protein